MMTVNHRLTHSLTQLISLCIASVTICHHMADTGNSLALLGLNLTEEEREALEGHRTLVLIKLKSSLARLCTELFKFLFKWHTVCSCQIVCHWWEVYSLHVSILHWSILIQESPASAMSAFMILSCLLVHCHCSNVTSCCIVECCASLAQALYLLSLLSKPRVEDICHQLSIDPDGKQDVDAWTLKTTWRHVKRTGSQICLSLSEKFIAVTFVLNNAFSCDWGHWKCLTCCD